MKKLITIYFLFYTHQVFADVSGDQISEVNHLLEFVKTSTCTINRNGSTHTGSDAVSHIKKKYDYFSDEITTTEQFVELSATKSTMSGKFYTVTCGSNKAVRTKDWLLDELENYRSTVRKN